MHRNPQSNSDQTSGEVSGKVKSCVFVGWSPEGQAQACAIKQTFNPLGPWNAICSTWNIICRLSTGLRFLRTRTVASHPQLHGIAEKNPQALIGALHYSDPDGVCSQLHCCHWLHAQFFTMNKKHKTSLQLSLKSGMIHSYIMIPTPTRQIMFLFLVNWKTTIKGLTGSTFELLRIMFCWELKL